MCQALKYFNVFILFIYLFILPWSNWASRFLEFIGSQPWEAVRPVSFEFQVISCSITRKLAMCLSNMFFLGWLCIVLRPFFTGTFLLVHCIHKFVGFFFFFVLILVMWSYFFYLQISQFSSNLKICGCSCDGLRGIWRFHKDNIWEFFNFFIWILKSNKRTNPKTFCAKENSQRFLKDIKFIMRIFLWWTSDRSKGMLV